MYARLDVFEAVIVILTHPLTSCLFVDLHYADSAEWLFSHCGVVCAVQFGGYVHMV